LDTGKQMTVGGSDDQNLMQAPQIRIHLKFNWH